MLDLKADDDGPNPQWIEFFVVFFGSEVGESSEFGGENALLNTRSRSRNLAQAVTWLRGPSFVA